MSRAAVRRKEAGGQYETARRLDPFRNGESVALDDSDPSHGRERLSPEGILKFVYTNQGVGRFTKLGIPFPCSAAFFVAVLQIVGVLFLISGFLTRAISIPFVIEMLVAMLSTKISLYLGTSPLPLPPSPPKIGAWAVLHEIRSEGRNS